MTENPPENPRARSIRLHEEFELYCEARELDQRLEEAKLLAEQTAKLEAA